MEMPNYHSALSAGQKLLQLQHKLFSIPGGRFIFNRILAYKIPYSASIGAKLVTLEPGHAIFILKDKRSIRNHLNSIHAIALTNLGELTSGLALNVGLANNVRGIVIHIGTDYIKKARGNLMAECRCEIPKVSNDIEYTVEALIKDSDETLVAKVSVDWRLGLKPAN